MAFPAPRRSRRLHDTAMRISDEIGKGQEMLRHFGPVTVNAVAGGSVRALLGIPDVDIRIVDLKVIGKTIAGATIDVLAPAAWATAPGAANRLNAAAVVDANLPDDTVYYVPLAALAGRIKAEQPIILSFASAGGGTGVLAVQASYVLADGEQVSYSNY